MAARNVNDILGANIVSGVGYGNPPDPSCSAPNMAEYIINLPAAALWEGDPQGIPAGYLQGIKLDLYQFQRVAFRAMTVSDRI